MKKKKKQFMDPLTLSGDNDSDDNSSGSSSSDEEPAAKKCKSEATSSAEKKTSLDPDPSELNLRAAPSLLAVPDPGAGNATWAWKACAKKTERDNTPTREEREADREAATLGVDAVAAAAAAAASRAAALREILRKEKQERDAEGRLSMGDKEARKRSEGEQKKSFVEDEKRQAGEAGGGGR